MFHSYVFIHLKILTCKKTYVKRRSLLKHMRTHITGRKHFCNICGLSCFFFTIFIQIFIHLKILLKIRPDLTKSLWKAREFFKRENGRNIRMDC